MCRSNSVYFALFPLGSAAALALLFCAFAADTSVANSTSCAAFLFLFFAMSITSPDDIVFRRLLFHDGKLKKTHPL
jgi:hypothetical protein